MKTLIKRPGGKTREFSNIKTIFLNMNATLNHFLEVVQFTLKLLPPKSIVNDISEDLIDFYRCIVEKTRRESFNNILYSYVDLWERIGCSFETTQAFFLDCFELYSKKNELEKSLIDKIDIGIEEFHKEFFLGFSENVIIDKNNLIRNIQQNIISKIQRMHKIATLNGGISQEDIRSNLETAIRSGFYMHFRDLLNDKEKYKLSKEKYISNYYFIREFCYGSMFRYKL